MKIDMEDCSSAIRFDDGPGNPPSDPADPTSTRIEYHHQGMCTLHFDYPTMTLCPYPNVNESWKHLFTEPGSSKKDPVPQEKKSELRSSTLQYTPPADAHA
jgi:hypothetical protein